MSGKEIGVEGAIMLAPEISGNLQALGYLNVESNRLSSRELAPYGFGLQCLSCSCPACYLRLKPQWCLHGGISAERDQQFCVDGAMVGAVAV